MLTMHRWFKIDRAIEDLNYEPIITYEDGWNDTLAWFKEHWLTKYKNDDGSGTSTIRNKSAFGAIASNTKAKIDIQAGAI